MKIVFLKLFNHENSLQLNCHGYHLKLKHKCVRTQEKLFALKYFKEFPQNYQNLKLFGNKTIKKRKCKHQS
jgi:hypothetical protein